MNVLQILVHYFPKLGKGNTVTLLPLSSSLGHPVAFLFVFLLRSLTHIPPGFSVQRLSTKTTPCNRLFGEQNPSLAESTQRSKIWLHRQRYTYKKSWAPTTSKWKLLQKLWWMEFISFNWPTSVKQLLNPPQLRQFTAMPWSQLVTLIHSHKGVCSFL